LSTSTTGSFNISSGTGCDYTAVSNASFITINSGASSGNGIISYSITAGTITVAGQVFTINQSSGCTYNVNPATHSLNPAGGSGTITVTTQPGCNWSATSDNSWITVTEGSSGTGDGTVTFTVASTGVARTGSLFVAGQTVVVNQAAPKSRKRTRFF
jgi:hypothetical protein